MRLTGQILSIGGGLYGILLALIVIVTGSLGTTFGMSGQVPVILIGIALLAISLTGILGGSMASAFPIRATLLQAAAGLLGFVLTPIGWILAGSALLIGSVLTFVGRDR